MKKINLQINLTLRENLSFNGLRAVLMVLLIACGVSQAFAGSAKFKLQKASTTPTGSGYIYMYRATGGAKTVDVLTTPTEWIPVENGTSVECETSNDGDDKGDGNVSQSSCALYIYMFAKPKPGYKFLGWKEDGSGDYISGSKARYKTGSSTGADTDWNNNVATNVKVYPAQGYNDGYYYLRHVEVQSSAVDHTYHTYFEVLPQAFTFGKAKGIDDASYTVAYTTKGNANYNFTVYESAVAKTAANDSTKGDITLTLGEYNTEEYQFSGWYCDYTDGNDAQQTGVLVSTSTPGTYSFDGDNEYEAAARKNVTIYPVFAELSNKAASVSFDGSKVFFDTWAEALADAIEKSASRGEKEAPVIKLLQSPEDAFTATQVISQSMTINLNGQTFTSSTAMGEAVVNFFEISGSGTAVILKDETAGAIQMNNADAKTTYAVCVKNGASLELDLGAGTVSNSNTKSDGTARGVEVQSGGSLTITSGHINATSLQNAYALINRGTTTIAGGELYANTTSGARTASKAVAFYNEGTASVENGTFRAYSHTYASYGIQQNVNKTLTIQDAIVNVEARGKRRNAKDTGDEAVAGDVNALYRSNGKILVKGGKYKAVAPTGFYPANSTNNNYIELKGGVYNSGRHLHECASPGYDRRELEKSSADYTNDYRYTVSDEATPKVCKVIDGTETTYYTSITDAFAYVEAHAALPLVIIPIAYNCTLPSGNYTVPAAATLLIPYDADNEKAISKGTEVTSTAGLEFARNCELFFEANTHLTVEGTLCVAGHQLGTTSGNPGPGSPVSTYGAINMYQGGSITIRPKAKLYVSGFIFGPGDKSTSGTITVESGAVVHENLIILDMRGGGGTAAALNGFSASNDYDLFPFSQYFIQNIEPKMTINYGAVEEAIYDIYSSSGGGQQDSMRFVGNTSSCLFQMNAGSSVTKWYDAARDYQCYEVNGNMSMNSIVVEATSTMAMRSSDFILPVNNNMEISVKPNSVLSIPYDIKFLPGSKVIIDEGAEAVINRRLFVYDSQDWDRYAIDYAKTVNSIPRHTVRTVSALSNFNDATFVVNGTLRFKDSNAAFYTTSNGSSITSTGSGKIVFDNVAPKSENTNLYEIWSTYGMASNGQALSSDGKKVVGEETFGPADGQVKVGSYSGYYVYAFPVTCTPAQLLNGDNTYTPTAGAAANDQFIYNQALGKWMKNPKTVTWDATTNGGSTDATTIIIGGGSALNTVIASMPEASKAHNTFNGWFTASTGGTEVLLATTVSADVTYYAQFTPDQYNIIYKDKDNADFSGVHGSGCPETHTYGAATTLVDPTKEGYTFEGWFDNPACTGSAITSLDATAYTADITLFAKWTINTHKLAWNFDGGTPSGVYTQANDALAYGSEITYPSSMSKAGYTFAAWSTSETSMPDADLTITATWHIASSDVLEVGETQERQITINSNETVTTTIVHADGKLDVSAGTLTTTDLILEASENASGQIIGADKITLTPSIGNAYFDLTHTGGFKARTWYAVAVPWKVAVPTNQVGGVYLIKGENEPVQQRLGQTFDLIFYDGERRATTGENKAWTYVEDYHAAHTEKYPVMEPGVAYMIYLTSDADVIRFKMTVAPEANAKLHTNNTEVFTYESPNDITTDENWNGIANPATYHAYLTNVGVAIGQVYIDPIKKRYDTFDMSKKLVVGQPVFVQAPVPGTVYVPEPTPSSAPRRAKEQVSPTRYDLMLAASDADVTDRVIVFMDENKTENEYVIGKDLVKMGVSDMVPQMWIDRYEKKMCVNTVAGFDNTADYPLGIFAPKNGEYDLFIDDQPNDETMLYLTYDGEAIWNLSYGGYVASLEKGTNTHYGLRIAKKAPQIATGIDEATVQNGEAVRKVLVNDKVYIIRNGEIYSVTGQKAK